METYTTELSNMEKGSELKNALIQWLCDDGYSLEISTEQINDAIITQEDDKVTIEYRSGLVDIVKIKNIVQILILP